MSNVVLFKVSFYLKLSWSDNEVSSHTFDMKMYVHAWFPKTAHRDMHGFQKQLMLV